MAQRTQITASILITSKDRKDELRVAVESALKQEGVDEVLVISDGSTDGTVEMLRDEYPQVRLVEQAQSQGLIVSRNRGVELAMGAVVVIIDDDAAFTHPRVVLDNLRYFAEARVGAVGIPFVNVNESDAVFQEAPDEGYWAIASYRGTAQALRRSLFLELGGYCGAFFHQGEEGEYCQRLWDKGYWVVAGCSGYIHHYESPKRDYWRRDVYGRRNDLFTAWLLMPWSTLWWRFPLIVLNGLWYGIKVRRPWAMLVGIGHGFKAICKYRRLRRPVSAECYRWVRRLRREGMIRMAVDGGNKT